MNSALAGLCVIRFSVLRGTYFNPLIRKWQSLFFEAFLGCLHVVQTQAAISKLPCHPSIYQDFFASKSCSSRAAELINIHRSNQARWGALFAPAF